MWPDFRPSITAVVSMRAPRPVLTIITPGFIRAMAAASIRWCVSGVSGQLSEMTSLRREQLVERRRSEHRAPAGRRRGTGRGRRSRSAGATACGRRGAPMLPGADDADRLAGPGRSRGGRRARSCRRGPGCRRGGIRRLRARTSASVCSATAFGEYAGTRTTVMPRATAAARSTWLYPAQRRATNRTPLSASAADHVRAEVVVHERAHRLVALRQCRGVGFQP